MRPVLPIPADTPALPYPVGGTGRVDMNEVPPFFMDRRVNHTFKLLGQHATVSKARFATQEGTGRRAMLIDDWVLVPRVPASPEELQNAIRTATVWFNGDEEDCENLIAWILWSWFELQEQAEVVRA